MDVTFDLPEELWDFCDAPEQRSVLEQKEIFKKAHDAIGLMQKELTDAFFAAGPKDSKGAFALPDKEHLNHKPPVLCGKEGHRYSPEAFQAHAIAVTFINIVAARSYHYLAKTDFEKAKAYVRRLHAQGLGTAASHAVLVTRTSAKVWAEEAELIGMDLVAFLLGMTSQKASAKDAVVAWQLLARSPPTCGFPVKKTALQAMAIRDNIRRFLSKEDFSACCAHINSRMYAV